MKAQVCLLAGSLLMVGPAAEAKGPKRGVKEVVLTASQVASARDIEEAMDEATDYGTHPGIVTLDSRDGDFFYTEADRSINIYWPSVTLRSLNGAQILNCGDGVFLDPGFPGALIVEGITFVCESVGVSAAWTEDYDHVAIQGNWFVCSLGIGVARSKDWVIADNRIDAGWAGIELGDCSGFTLSGNVVRAGDVGVNASLCTAVELAGNDFFGGRAGASFPWAFLPDGTLAGSTGVNLRRNQIEGGWVGLFVENGTDFFVHQNACGGFLGAWLLNQACGNRLVNNDITAQWQGVVLAAGAAENDVIANRIAGVESAGIALEWETAGNRVHGNRVACAEGAPSCEIIQAAPEVWEANDISGNTAW